MAYADDVQVGPFGEEISIEEFGNPVKAHLNDLNGRLVTHNQTLAGIRSDLGSGWSGTAALDRVTGLEAVTTDVESGNAALDDRVTALEATPPGATVNQVRVVPMDPDGTGFTPPTKDPTVFDAGDPAPTYLEFPDPGQLVTVVGHVYAGVYYLPSTGTGRGYVRPEISLDGGATWSSTLTSRDPWAGVQGGSLSDRTAISATSFSVSGTPTGTIRLRCRTVVEGSGSNNVIGFFKAMLTGEVRAGEAGVTGR